ncbi:hypothetical protein ACWEPL_53925 [Nonomuraea sp. NPDC004186]
MAPWRRRTSLGVRLAQRAPDRADRDAGRRNLWLKSLDTLDS